MLLLVPADPLSARKPDEHFAPEADAARELGLDVVLIDDDAIRGGNAAAAVRSVPEASGDVVYRGWMLRSEEYLALASALSERGAKLRTPPEQYAAAHELPGWYEVFRDHTARSVWLDGPGLDGIEKALLELADGAAVVKDYVKSEKHYWDEAAFIPDVGDVDAARAIASRFLELRGEDLVGGLVFRTFETYGPSEVRSWWIDGRDALVTAHPDQQQAAVAAVPTNQFAESVAALGSPFVTVDLALRQDGVWRVVEVGDGQVSDRPETTPADELIDALAKHRQPDG